MENYIPEANPNAPNSVRLLDIVQTYNYETGIQFPTRWENIYHLFVDGLKVREAEIDFVDGAYDGTFTITDADATENSSVLCQLAIKSPSDGRSPDEALWESEVMSISAKATAGHVIFYVKNRLWGKFFGKFIINYQLTTL